MKVAIATLGCKVNQYDSASLESRLAAAGCDVVPFGPGADAYVINSCSVTGVADAESRRLARRARRLAPAARVVMTGCFAQASPGAAAIPEVDAVVGLNRPGDLLAAIRGGADFAGRAVLVSDLREARSIAALDAETFCGQTRAFLKVQEGCDLFCSFCIVPFARGRSRSVAPREVMRHLRRLAERGYREVVLTGVHLGAYGEDLNPRTGLADLLEMIAESAPLPRVRLSSVDPPELTARLLRIVGQSAVLCPHFHVPVQAGDDAVLRRMARRYSVELAREALSRARSELPMAGIGADLLAGFPGETATEFANTEKFVEEAPFTYLHVFPYSIRRGTTAAKLPGRPAPRVVAERARRLREIGARKRSAFEGALIGRVADVLLERGGGGRKDLMTGYTRNYARVRVAADESLANREVAVRIMGSDSDGLLGAIDTADG